MHHKANKITVKHVVLVSYSNKEGKGRYMSCMPRFLLNFKTLLHHACIYPPKSLMAYSVMPWIVRSVTCKTSSDGTRFVPV